MSRCASAPSRRRRHRLGGSPLAPSRGPSRSETRSCPFVIALSTPSEGIAAYLVYGPPSGSFASTSPTNRKASISRKCTKSAADPHVPRMDWGGAPRTTTPRPSQTARVTSRRLCMTLAFADLAAGHGGANGHHLQDDRVRARASGITVRGGRLDRSGRRASDHTCESHGRCIRRRLRRFALEPLDPVPEAGRRVRLIPAEVRTMTASSGSRETGFMQRIRTLAGPTLRARRARQQVHAGRRGGHAEAPSRRPRQVPYQSAMRRKAGVSSCFRDGQDFATGSSLTDYRRTVPALRIGVEFSLRFRLRCPQVRSLTSRVDGAI